MDLFVSLYASYGLCIIVVLLIFQYLRTMKRKFEGFPTRHHFVPYIVYCQITGKVPKGIPCSSFIFQELVDMCTKRMKEGICLIHLYEPNIFIFGEDSIKVFSSDKAAVDKTYHYKTLADGLGYGLITLFGEKWKKHRKLINPAFHLNMLKEKVPEFNKHALALVKDFESLVDKSSSDILPFVKRHLLNSLCESVLGLKTEENKADIDKLFHSVDNLCEMMVYKAFHPWFRWDIMLNLTPLGKKYNEMKNICHDFTNNVILKMKELVLRDTTFSENMHKSFTHILLDQHLKDPLFTFDDLHNEVRTIMGAGYDTVSYTMLWCLFLLGLHPEVQEKAFNEVQSDSEGYISYENSCTFTYLESVIMETLRLYPVVPLFSRENSKDLQCGKYTIPKGTTVSFFPYVWHRNPELYPDPEKFDPDRFSSEVSRKSWAHIPFSEGNRSCIGKRYALIEMKIFLAHILRNFKIISLDKREDIVLNWKIVLAPVTTLCFHIEPRHRQASQHSPKNI